MRVAIVSVFLLFLSFFPAFVNFARALASRDRVSRISRKRCVRLSTNSSFTLHSFPAHTDDMHMQFRVSPSTITPAEILGCKYQYKDIGARDLFPTVLRQLESRLGYRSVIFGATCLDRETRETCGARSLIQLGRSNDKRGHRRGLCTKRGQISALRKLDNTAAGNEER